MNNFPLYSHPHITASIKTMLKVQHSSYTSVQSGSMELRKEKKIVKEICASV